jgi:hypothetical protein
MEYVSDMVIWVVNVISFCVAQRRFREQYDGSVGMAILHVAKEGTRSGRVRREAVIKDPSPRLSSRLVVTHVALHSA